MALLNFAKVINDKYTYICYLNTYLGKLNQA